MCYQASPETRLYAVDHKIALHDYEPEISDVLVPNCIYRCGCPEMTECPAKFFEELCEHDEAARSTNIQERYDAYNRHFWSVYK